MSSINLDNVGTVPPHEWHHMSCHDMETPLQRRHNQRDGGLNQWCHKSLLNQLKLQSCLINIIKWYWENLLKINSEKSKVMLVGSKAQLKSLNVDEFISKHEGTPLELVENIKYLDVSFNSDISWNSHVQPLYQNMYYHLSLLRRLRRILANALLMQVFKSYIKPRLDYDITLYGCTIQKNIDLVQMIQNHAARLITGNFVYINCRGIDLIKSLNLCAIHDRGAYFLTVLMFKFIHEFSCSIN